ncbi:insulinase family protein [Clostridium sp. 'deep sea']|uniref:EF-P 5-aminopentanol modification-associated protein YfmH n=1 Tax=Clostridium sp. 'deep sea' TaxID=2779445 RepID=UPI0018967446|nr:pitrilysin family protein [Clostridium sp. 'deep sea']QOR35664.1 insulinase family protein [Clostridium sp. 'deep sea']
MQNIIKNKLNEDITKTTLANGLEVFIHPKKDYHSKYAIFATRYGSNDNDFIGLDGKRHKVPNGIAHFLEHKMFEEPTGNVFNDYSNMGVSVNAYTNYNMTAYLFSGTKNFYKALERLLDFVQNPYFTDENVAKEQGIIEQEIKMYDDQSGWILQRNLLECLYKNHPIRIDIAGTVESINKITKEMLYTCYHTFYNPSNMVLYIAGDVDVNKVIKEVANNQSKKDFKQLKKIERFFPEEPVAVNCSFDKIKMPIASPLMAVGYKEKPLIDPKARFKREMLTNLVNHLVIGKSSPLFNDLYEKGLVTDDFSVGHTGTATYSYEIYGGPTPDPQKLHQELLAGFDRAKQQGISRDAFERARRMFAGLHTISYDNLSMIANRYVSYLIKGIDFYQYNETLNALTLEEINERLQQCYNKKYHAFSVVEPN